MPKKPEKTYYRNKYCEVITEYEDKSVIRLASEAFIHEDYDSERFEVAELDIIVDTKDLTCAKIDVTKKEKALIEKLRKESISKRDELRTLKADTNRAIAENVKVMAELESNRSLSERVKFLMGLCKKWAGSIKEASDCSRYVSIGELIGSGYSDSLTIVPLKGGDFELKKDYRRVFLGDSKEEVQQKIVAHIQAKEIKSVNLDEAKYCEEHGDPSVRAAWDAFYKERERKRKEEQLESTKREMERLEKELVAKDGDS